MCVRHPTPASVGFISMYIYIYIYTYIMCIYIFVRSRDEHVDYPTVVPMIARQSFIHQLNEMANRQSSSGASASHAFTATAGNSGEVGHIARSAVFPESSRQLQCRDVRDRSQTQSSRGRCTSLPLGEGGEHHCDVHGTNSNRRLAAQGAVAMASRHTEMDVMSHLPSRSSIDIEVLRMLKANEYEGIRHLAARESCFFAPP